MSWLSRLFAGLFGRRGRAVAVSPLDLGPPRSLAAAPPEAAPVLAPPPPQPAEPEPVFPEGAAVVEVETDEQVFEEEERAEDGGSSETELDARPDLDLIVAERLAHLDETRSVAERAALSGEQRVRLTDPAGPGTLAEALARLEREGRVVGRLEEDEDGAPVMVYAPAAAPDRVGIFERR